jgi:hypothetical protein
MPLERPVISFDPFFKRVWVSFLKERVRFSILLLQLIQLNQLTTILTICQEIFEGFLKKGSLSETHVSNNDQIKFPCFHRISTRNPLSLEGLCHNERKTTFVAKPDGGSGDEALERKPFNGQLLSSKPLKRSHLNQSRLPIALNDCILKLRSLIPPGRDPA